MAKPLKVIGTIAGAVALVATGVGAFAVAGSALAATAASVASIASITATVANIGSQALTKPPPARGSVTQLLVSPNAPQPYVMGEGYFAGVLRHDTAYGATLSGVPNPYRFLAVVYSGGGPIQSIAPRVDFGTPSSWYSTYLYTGTKLGAVPDTALTPQWSGAPGWSTAHKLSGQAAIGWSAKFDKDGKRFASGLPVIGAYGQWVKVYDPRLDSTQPGGSGSHRLGNEATYTYSDNPALHAGTYAFGRYQNGKRVIGVGLPADGIDWPVIAAWANVCDANGWTMFGVVYEPGDRWANLKDICLAGGGEPVATGILTFRYSAPTIALDTITAADLADTEQSVTAMQTWRDRINTAVPQYRSPDHNWEIVDAAAVVNATFLAEDGEEKREVWPFSFVKDSDQAAQLAAYRLFDSREIAPIILNVQPRLRNYRPGECLDLDLPELGLDGPAIIRRRSINPANMAVTLELIGETTEKHAYCLGRTGTPPPTPALSQTAQERDEVAAAAGVGEDGVSPPLVRLSATNTQARYDGAGNYIGGPITFTATRENIPPGTVWGWQMRRVSDDALIVGDTAANLAAAYPLAFSTTGPDNLTHTAGGVNYDISTYGALRFVAYADGYTVRDSVTITPVQDGDDGADGSDALSASALPPAIVFRADPVGNLEAGQLPYPVELAAMFGPADVTGTATFAVVQTSNTSATVSGDELSITAVAGADGYADVEATYGVFTDVVRVPWTKVRRGAAATTYRSGEITAAPSGWNVATNVVTFNYGPDDNAATIAASAVYDIGSTGTVTLQMRVMVRNVSDGGSWTQLGSTASASPPATYAIVSGDVVTTQGAVGTSQSMGTPPASRKVYEARIEILGDIRVSYITGSMSIEVS